MIEPRHTATVRSQEKIAEGIYSMWIATPAAKSAAPGQFINIYTNDHAHILPRPISICEYDRDRELIRVVYRVAGYGTDSFSSYTEGDDIDIMGPLGNGFPETDGKVVLFGGGIGIPPMLSLAKEYKERAIAVLGYRDETFLMSDFEQTGCEIVVATEDGSVGTKGTVIDAVSGRDIQADTVFACGPLPMLRAVKDYSQSNGIRAFVSMEERMACGVGACLGCVTKTKNKDEHSNVYNTRICKDGPVFPAEEVEL